jgi:hypothetical protein
MPDSAPDDDVTVVSVLTADGALLEEASYVEPLTPAEWLEIVQYLWDKWEMAPIVHKLPRAEYEAKWAWLEDLIRAKEAGEL